MVVLLLTATWRHVDRTRVLQGYCKGYCPVMTSVPVVPCGRLGNFKNHLGALLVQSRAALLVQDLSDALARDSDYHH